MYFCTGILGHWVKFSNYCWPQWSSWPLRLLYSIFRTVQYGCLFTGILGQEYEWCSFYPQQPLWPLRLPYSLWGYHIEFRNQHNMASFHRYFRSLCSFLTSVASMASESANVTPVMSPLRAKRATFTLSVSDASCEPAPPAGARYRPP